MSRDRLPQEVHSAVVTRGLAVAQEKGRLKGGHALEVNSITLDADVVLQRIVRKDTVEDWRKFLIRPMRDEGTTVRVKIPRLQKLKQLRWPGTAVAACRPPGRTRRHTSALAPRWALFNLESASSDMGIRDVVADQGCRAARDHGEIVEDTLARTYIP